MAVKLEEKIMDAIISDYYLFGKSQAQIANDHQVGETSVLNTIRTFEAVKKEDWNEVIRLKNVGVSTWTIRWAAMRIGKELPKEVEAAISNKRTAAPAEQKTEANKNNENIYLIRVLEELAKQNELMQQLIDVVIPKYTEDTRVAIMKNAVVLCNKLQHTIDDVSGMKDVLCQIHEELK